MAAVNIRLDVHASSSSEGEISEAYVEDPANSHHRSTTNTWRSIYAFASAYIFEDSYHRCSRFNLHTKPTSSTTPLSDQIQTLQPPYLQRKTPNLVPSTILSPSPSIPQPHTTYPATLATTPVSPSNRKHRYIRHPVHRSFRPGLTLTLIFTPCHSRPFLPPLLSSLISSNKIAAFTMGV